MGRNKKNKKRNKRIRHSPLAKWWRRYSYKHTTLALLFFICFYLMLNTALVQGLLLSVKDLGLLGIFITGIFFVSFFTAGPATLILLSIASDHHPLLIASIAGTGAILGDFIILRFFEEQVGYELAPLAKKYGVMPMIKQMKSRKFRPIAILVAMIFIASPGPDEVGLGLLGLTNTPLRKLLPILFLLNTGGIYLLVLGARAVISV